MDRPNSIETSATYTNRASTIITNGRERQSDKKKTPEIVAHK